MPPEKIEVRISVVEEKQKNLQEDVKELKQNTNEIYDVVQDLRDRVIKQNGSIPHIVKHVESISKKQGEMSEKMTAQMLTSKDTSWKVKIMWGGAGLLASGVVAMSVKLISVLLAS